MVKMFISDLQVSQFSEACKHNVDFKINPAHPRFLFSTDKSNHGYQRKFLNLYEQRKKKNKDPKIMTGLAHYQCTRHKNKEETHLDRLCKMHHKNENHADYMKHKSDPKRKYRIISYKSREKLMSLVDRNLKAGKLTPILRYLWQIASRKY